MILFKRSNLLYLDCYILPFENLKGKIIAITESQHGIEFQVRYCLNGEYKREWFFDFDLSLEQEEK